MSLSFFLFLTLPLLLMPAPRKIERVFESRANSFVGTAF
jgi:hypothetical protein